LKAWWFRMSLWKGPVVGTPVITVSSSASSTHTHTQPCVRVSSHAGLCASPAPCPLPTQ
jgi:hypothetical protein